MAFYGGGSISRLVTRWTDPDGHKDKQRAAIQQALETLLDQVYQTPVASMPEHLVCQLAIDLQIQDLDASARSFFTPWSADRLAQHQTNAACESTADVLRDMEEELQVYASPCDPLGAGNGFWDIAAWVHLMCQRLAWEVRRAPRRGTRGDMATIELLSGWQCFHGLPFGWRLRGVVDAMTDPWYLAHHWILPGHHPHVKVSVYHEKTGRPELLLRGELLTILAVMISRLEKEYLQRHLIIPVMLFSFMGPHHGRIIEAHFDGLQLVVRMSPLHRFLVGEHRFEENLFLFTRYLASEMDARGDTTRVPRMAEV